MTTSEKILSAALALFARDGYEAVSISAIAGELGLSKGALYRHYASKRDIFDKIVERMYQMDSTRAAEHGVPLENFNTSKAGYRSATASGLKKYLMAQFRVWTEDEFTCNFRQLITLEQYRSPEMAALYQSCLAQGPVDYLTDLLREGMAAGVWQKAQPRQLALELYAPFYLLLSVSSGTKNAARQLAAHLNQFIKKHSLQEQ
jgi:AcrR family transcriptional regulator